MQKLIRYILVLQLGLSSAFLAGQLPAATLEVPEDFSTIQAAIDVANPGDEVLVAPGTYSVNLNLKAEVDVRGDEAARTFLRAADQTLAIVEGASVSAIRLSNFSFVDSVTGVRLLSATGVDVTNNVFDTLSGAALVVGAFSDVRIDNNVFWRNSQAIDRFTTQAPITNNIFAENTLTVASTADTPIAPDFNVSFNCFYENNDLVAGGQQSLGTDFQVGDPMFVDTAVGDFHLRQGSVCIDTGTGTDVIDDSAADMGAYGGEFADVRPFPVAQPTATDSSTSNPDVFSITLDWPANLAYLVTSDTMPGGYRVWYQLNEPGPDYEGTDAGNGTLPSPVDVGDTLTYTLSDLQPENVSPPAAPTLASADPRNQSVRLNWSAVEGASAYRVHYGVTSTAEQSVDAGNVTDYTVGGLENGVEYVFAVSARSSSVYYLAVTAYDSTPDTNESDYSEEVSIAIGDSQSSELSNELSAEPDEVVPYPDLPDEGCFVATAAYGADWVAEVLVLRKFRDQYLLKSLPGRRFVAWYYRHGPAAAAWLQEHAFLKPVVRGFLMPLVALAAFILGASATVKGLVCVLGIALLWLVFRLWHFGGRSGEFPVSSGPGR